MEETPPSSSAKPGLFIGRGSHGEVRSVPDEPRMVVKCIEAIKIRSHGGWDDEPYFSIDAILEPAAIRRLNSCGCPFIVEMNRVEVQQKERRVDLYLEKLEPLCEDDAILTPQRAQKYVSQLVAAVATMNACGVFHRDIKTVNVMRTSKDAGDNVRLIDFSLALLDAPRLTREPDQMYTTNYRAPEVILGYAHYDREKAESWALGVTCAEILSGLGGHNMFRGVKWYHVLSSIVMAFPTVDFSNVCAFYPGWRDFSGNGLFRDGWWRYGDSTSLHKVLTLLAGEQAADFVACACEPRPERRWTAAMLLAHPFVRDQPWCRVALAEQQHMRMPRSVPITTKPRFITGMPGLGHLDSQVNIERRALAEGLLRFLALDASDPSAYCAALVLTGALCYDQAQGFNSDAVMKLLATPGVVEFFSRHVYVLIKEDDD